MIDIEAVLMCLNPNLVDDSPPPQWLEILEKIIEAANQTKEVFNSNDYNFSGSTDSIPFIEIYVPFLQVAQKQLLQAGGYQCALLSESAYKDLEASLLERLSHIASQTLELEFSIFRSLTCTPLDLAILKLEDSSGKQIYRNFIKRIYHDGLVSLLQEYSVLARLLATTVSFWVEDVLEFTQRLETDWIKIQIEFQSLQELGTVVAIEPNSSDLHNGGRSVYILEFSSGLKLAYKPKNLEVDVAYYTFLAWLNNYFTNVPFKLVTIISCNTYGWMEYVEAKPAENQDSVKKYYQRSGMLLCVIYFLGGTDCHNENLIAQGEHPVLIDLESLLHPQVIEAEGYPDNFTQAQLLAGKQLDKSVIRTGLLPQWDLGMNGHIAYDISGLGGVGEQTTPYQAPKWKDINTDSMKLSYEISKAPAQANTCYMKDIPVFPSEYVEEITCGFRNMYNFLHKSQPLLLSSSSPINQFKGKKIRFIFRSTKVYKTLINRTLNPKFLRNGIDRSIELDSLSKAFLQAKSKPSFWSILSRELRSIEQLDIPYFATSTDTSSLLLSEHETIQYFSHQSSYADLVARVNSLCDADLAQQISIIRATFHSKDTTPSGYVEALYSSTSEQNAISPLGQSELINLAQSLAMRIKDSAIFALDGSITWIGFKYFTESQRCQLQPVGYSLYDGICGVALFLASFEYITGGSGYRDFIFRALKPIYLNNKSPLSTKRMIEQIGIGGLMGCASIIYSLLRISQFLNEPELEDLATKIAVGITEEQILNDKSLDIISGSAGTVLGLLAIYYVANDVSFLNKAIVCGHHLLNSCHYDQDRRGATPGTKLLTGFAHGASGFSYSLLCLYEATHDTNFLNGAINHIKYERSAYSAVYENWLDFRTEPPSFMNSWCHGAPGIGLSRLGSLTVLDTEAAREEIQIALKTTQKFGIRDMDHLCCGNFGRIDLFLSAAQKLNSPHLLEVALLQTSQLSIKAQQLGGFCLSTGFTKNNYNPGFFRGLSGIGYEVLRVAFPSLLPSVLLWE